ncbi:response regulator [Desulfoplanes formicivorans]|uniref:Histidine kinase n=1 Tax=Desulfoplanes formicivorans TaxID=1592317 RepID=A0A194AE98_9BACT|nr:response regulator [Desulfoplanes formicivorans]GAU08407.1 histidine kinase [Desulfoplanes formicivorans]
MPSISIFHGNFVHSKEIGTTVADVLGYELVYDQDLITKASERFNIAANKITRAVYEKPSAFDSFTHEKARCVAYLKSVMASDLARENVVYYGFLGHLIPESVSHVLKVCLIADRKARLEVAQATGLSEKEAQKAILRHDESCAYWTDHLFHKEPWDASLYDIIIPTDKKERAECVDIIVKSVNNEILRSTEKSRQAVADFVLAAKVELALAKSGHSMKVTADQGDVTIVIEKNVIMLSRLEDELKQIASEVEGVKAVYTKVGPNFYRNDVYRRYDFETPTKVLLVDDEREFVETLSERMLMRDMGSHVVYDGKEALDFVQEEEPEVMVLDLRMPGVDGYEVLRRIKKEHPRVEVIILTGHGSEADRAKCMEMGAFAYLEKPVNIDKLAETLKAAKAKYAQS